MAETSDFNLSKIANSLEDISEYMKRIYGVLSSLNDNMDYIKAIRTEMDQLNENIRRITYK